MTWFRSDEQRVNPDAYYVFVFFANSRAALATCLEEMPRHARVVAGTEGGPDNYGDLGLRYGAHVKASPYRSFQARELEAQMRYVTGERVEVRIGELGRWEQFTAWMRAGARSIGEPARELASSAGSAARDVASGAGDALRGAGNLAQSLGEGTRAAGFLAELGGPVTGLLLLAGVGYVAYRVLGRRGVL